MIIYVSSWRQEYIIYLVRHGETVWNLFKRCNGITETFLNITGLEQVFRWNLAFQIRNVDHAEPSDWEIAGRYIGWTVLTIMALALFIMGLQ